MELNKRSLVAVLVLLLAISVLPAPVWAQAVSGDIVGTVLDPTGAVIPNVSVNVVNTSTGLKMTTQTNTSGQYRFVNLPIGIYEISTSATGYGVTTVKAPVELNRTNTVQLTLHVGTVSTEVQVAGVAP